MLYAINVLKKIIMKEKSYILFWKVKKMWILKHVCLQSTPWTMFCLMKSLCYYCPTFVIPVFLTFSVIVLFSNALSSIFFNSSKSTVVVQDFAYSTCAKAFFPGMFFVFLLGPCFPPWFICTTYVAAAARAAAVLKQQHSIPQLWQLEYYS